MKALLLLLALWAPGALATPEIPLELKDVGVEEKLGSAVDLNLLFRDETGLTVPLRTVVNGHKPTLLFLVYYSCPSLCNFFLNGALEVMKKMSLSPGKDYNILTVSIDPRETPELAAKKRQSYLQALGRKGAEEGWRFWVNDQTMAKIPAEMQISSVAKAGERLTSARALADQVGFRYRYDPKDDQYAHAAAMMVLTPEGKISRYLYGISFQPRDLRLALVEAADSKIGNAIDRLLLFCYHYDPKSRTYAIFISNLMRAASAVTVLLIGLWVALLFRSERRKPTPTV